MREPETDFGTKGYEACDQFDIDPVRLGSRAAAGGGYLDLCLGQLAGLNADRV